MYRMARFLFGPVLFLVYCLCVWYSLKPLEHCSGLLGQTIQVVGTAWVILAILTEVLLVMRVFSAGGKAKLNFFRVLWSWVSLLASTYGTAFLWLRMSENADGSLFGFMANIAIFFVALFTLCMVPVSMSFLVRSMIIVDKPKKR